MLKAATSPKQKFVDAALGLFAERGFYGVSLADVAAEIGVTKQAVLHHFKTKEALYAEVLRQLAERFEAIVTEARGARPDSESRLALYLERLNAHWQAEPRDARLVARELLDNLDRAETSWKWYLKAFLDESVALLAEQPQWQTRSLAEQTVAVYQLIGAINYFAISGATLKGIWGAKRTAATSKAFLPTLLQQAAIDEGERTK